MDVEPSLTDIIKLSLDDLSEFANPSLLTGVVSNLSNG